MANVLGTLFQDIADAIRTKTGGTGTLAPADFPGEILSITGGSGGGSEETLVTIFPETELSFAFNETTGAYTHYEHSVPVLFTIGDTYIVSWDGVSYTCTVQDMSALATGATGMGNLANFGGTGNNEPFVIGLTEGTMILIAFDTQPTHTVGLFQEAPAGGEWIFAGGNFKSTAYTHTVEHNLGVVPDVVYVYVQGTGNPSGSTTQLMSAILISEKMFGNATVTNDSEIYFGAGTFYNAAYNNVVSFGTLIGLENCVSSNSGELRGVYDVTETTFTVGGSNQQLSTDFGYSWGAFAKKS